MIAETTTTVHDALRTCRLPVQIEDILAAHPEIPWAEMRAMRNVVVHEYFGATNETLWKTAREDLPGVVGPLRRLLDQP